NPQPTATTTLQAPTVWTLTILDDDTGVNYPPDVVDPGEGEIPVGATELVLTAAMFGIDDVDSPLSALKVTLVTLPTLGELRRSAKTTAVLGVGDSFTLAEADLGAIVYAFFGATSTSAEDLFTFTIEDEGGIPSAPISFTITVPAGTSVGDWARY
ncbi:MAG: hypothetical protein KF858_04580, partial [Candidatus Sumerlaeia bacterium]|nr:hypothetical protein [Candidatus Sumerlaeia bacterium]